MLRWILALGLSLFTCLASAEASSAADQLIKQLGQLKSFQAQFTQTTFDDSGTALQTLAGLGAEV